MPNYSCSKCIVQYLHGIELQLRASLLSTCIYACAHPSSSAADIEELIFETVKVTREREETRHDAELCNWVFQMTWWLTDTQPLVVTIYGERGSAWLWMWNCWIERVGLSSSLGSSWHCPRLNWEISDRHRDATCTQGTAHRRFFSHWGNYCGCWTRNVESTGCGLAIGICVLFSVSCGELLVFMDWLLQCSGGFVLFCHNVLSADRSVIFCLRWFRALTL